MLRGRFPRGVHFAFAGATGANYSDHHLPDDQGGDHLRVRRPTVDTEWYARAPTAPTRDDIIAVRISIVP